MEDAAGLREPAQNRTVRRGVGRSRLRRPGVTRRRASARSLPPVGRVLGGRGRGLDPGPRGVRPAGFWAPTSEQLGLAASLIDAGVGVEQTFAALEGLATSDRGRESVLAVARAIGEGVSIAGALHERGAQAHVVALVAAGERTGRPADALRAAAALTGRMEDLRTTLGRALVYPSVVLAIGVAMLMLIAVTIVPQLERTFLELGGELPLVTRIVVAASGVLQSAWFVASVATLVVFRRRLRRAFERAGLTGFLRALPLARRLYGDVTVVVIARVIAALLSGGVPFVDALREAARALPDGRERERVERAAGCVERGGSAFDDDALGRLIGPVDREILAVAERTGLLADQWRRVGERRGQALDERVARMGSVLEPLLVVIVGAIVGGAVIALYLPTFRILDLI